MKIPISLVALALTAGAFADFIPANEVFVGVDSRGTIPSGTYAGLANPNYNRLTFLYGHQYDGSDGTAASSSHFHAKTGFGYSGDAASPTTFETASNFLPETSGLALTLSAGSGAFSGLLVSGRSADEHYGNTTIRPVSWLNRPGAAAWETATYDSGGATPSGRWQTPLGNADLALEVVSFTSGMRMLSANGATSVSGAGDLFAIGVGDFATRPVFAVDGTAPGGTDYVARLRLRDLTNTFGSSSTFEYRFRTATPVPEPATFAALGLGLAALARRRRKTA